MKELFIYFLTLLCNISVAQQGYFNRRIDDNGNSIEYATSIYADTTNFWIVYSTSWNAGPGYLLTTAIVTTDLIGNVTDRKVYSIQMVHNYSGWCGSLIKTDFGFIMAGAIQDTISTDAAIYYFNNNSDLINLRRYGDFRFQSGFMCKQCNNDCLAMCGQEGDSTFGSNNMMFLKIDSAGNLLWKYNYGDSLNGEFADSFIETADGGFALAGEKKYNINHSDGYLVKTDSAGIFQWELTLGSVDIDYLYTIISSSDGKILSAGAWGGPNWQSVTPYMVKIDLFGNIIWQRTYGAHMRESGIYSIRELPSSDIIAVGESTGGNGPSFGFVLKTNTNGDSLWYREYHPTSNSMSHGHLKDIYPLADGGFVACGWVDPIAPDTGNQDIWILRIDSNGCEVSNCIVGVNELFQDQSEYKIYPNPFSDIIHINSQLENPVEYTLYDQSGQEKLSGKLTQKAESIETDALSSGIYHLVLKNDKRVFHFKLMHL